jgi:hypothetical protein
MYRRSSAIRIVFRFIVVDFRVNFLLMPQRFYSSTLEETQWKFLVTKKDGNTFSLR